MTEVQIFSGGYRDATEAVLWGVRFGRFDGTGQMLMATSGETAPQFPEKHHAEAQMLGLMCADAAYSARIRVEAGAAADLQFRISDRGRYGVRLQVDGLVLYRMQRQDRPCAAADGNVVAHCPDWDVQPDEPIWTALSTTSFTLVPGSVHRLSVQAFGRSLRVGLDDVAVFDETATDDVLAVGRLGVYVWGNPTALPLIAFSDLQVLTAPARASNFALLYSTPGYELDGTKRALVRTLNDLPASLLVPEQSGFVLRRSSGDVVLTGSLSAGDSPLASNGPPAKTFGMQHWEADFSAVREEGTFRLHAHVATTEGTIRLESAPFPIRAGLVTASLLKPLSLVNADARRAADEDFWRNWIRQSGAWSVGVDGAFIADRADAGVGAVLRRVFNRNNGPLNLTNFRFMARITIVSGCDAQLQFRITPAERWGVTLLAGDGGGCTAATGNGALRLHHEAPGVWEALATRPFPLEGLAGAFVAGRAYDVEIVASDARVTVIVDGIPQLVDVPVPVREGGFALMAWSSTVRFERVQVWPRDAELLRSPRFSRIPMLHGIVAWKAALSNPTETEDRCNPWFSQLTGFHDCNNIIGEATSHGAFLAGLMDVWTRRSRHFTQADRESLRRAIVTNVLYLHELFEQSGASGEFAHSEMGRGGIYTNLGRHQSLLALYGLAAFADGGSVVDRMLARRSCEQATLGARWLWPQGTIDDPVSQSIIYARLARATEREGLPPTDAATQRTYWDLAIDAAELVVARFGAPDAIAAAVASGGCRDTGRVIPWFEGVYEVLRSHPDRRAQYADRLDQIASLLVSHLTQPHPCDDDSALAASCRANGFRVLPQASGAPNDTIARHNWQHMDRVPDVERPTTLAHVHFFEGNHFAVAASDAVYLGQILGRRDLEPVAAGNFYWTLGLNPGVPAAKVVNGAADGAPWQAASLVYNGAAAFARTIDGHRTGPSSAKGWVAPWETSAASPFRETWWIDPQNRSTVPENRHLQSIVNGHVIWDGALDYWSSGTHGWSSGETFLRNDGTFLKAALLFEDWLANRTDQWQNPYAIDRPAFFDTSHLDRDATGWGFDDPARTLFAHAGRAAHGFALAKAYGGGRFTGHHAGERLGLLCVPSAGYFDVTDEEIRSTPWNFADLNQAPWAQIARAATALANARNYVGGFFTGHQLNGRRGLVCLGANVAQSFDATDQDLFNSGEGFADINTVHWAQSARAATNICLARGYAGGFFTGHRVPGKIGLVGILP